MGCTKKTCPICAFIGVKVFDILQSALVVVMWDLYLSSRFFSFAFCVLSANASDDADPLVDATVADICACSHSGNIWLLKNCISSWWLPSTTVMRPKPTVVWASLSILMVTGIFYYYYYY